MRRRSLRVLALLMSLFLLTSCGEQLPGDVPEWNAVGEHRVWGIGDSQAASAGDPRRGPGWGERLGLGDAWGWMYGGGWIARNLYTGETAGERVERLITQAEVELIVIMIGVNDLYVATAEEVLPVVDDVDTRARARGVEIVYVTIPPLPSRSPLLAVEDQRQAMNDNLLATFPGRVVDCSAAMTDDGFLPDHFAMAPDDLHLNDAGEQALADCIAASPILAGRLPD